MRSKVYETTKVTERTKLDMAEHTSIGDFCFIGVPLLKMKDYSAINCYTSVIGRKNVTIGERSQVGYYCLLVTSTDQIDACTSDMMPEELRNIKTGSIEIGNDVYIGPHVTILPGVKIGDGAAIGAYSFVNRDVEPWTVTWGQPCEFKKKREKVWPVK